MERAKHRESGESQQKTRGRTCDHGTCLLRVDNHCPTAAGRSFLVERSAFHRQAGRTAPGAGWNVRRQRLNFSSSSWFASRNPGSKRGGGIGHRSHSHSTIRAQCGGSQEKNSKPIRMRTGRFSMRTECKTRTYSRFHLGLKDGIGIETANAMLLQPPL